VTNCLVVIGSDGIETTSGRALDASFDDLIAASPRALTIVFADAVFPASAFDAAAAPALDRLSARSRVIALANQHGVAGGWDDALTRLPKLELAKKLAGMVVDKVWGRLTGGARGGGATMSTTEIAAELHASRPFDALDELAPRAAALPPSTSLQAELEEEFEYEIAADRSLATPAEATGARGVLSTAALAKGLALVAYRTIVRAHGGRDHGLFPTVVEEILREVYASDVAQWLWTGAKDSLAAWWRPDDGGRAHVGSRLIDRLSDLRRRQPSLKLSVVGYGLGALGACHLLDTAAAQHAPIGVGAIALLSPLCTIDQFQRSVASHADRWAALRVYMLSDEAARADSLVPGLYARALPYFVSGVVEEAADTPLLGLERHTFGAAPYDAPELREVSELLHGERGLRVVAAPTPPGTAPERRSGARTHRAFLTDPDTIESLAAFLGA
jgi:hypothetical protein